TAEVSRQITAAAYALNDQYAKRVGQPVVQRIYSLLGDDSRGSDRGSHVAEVIVELLPSEDRDIPSKELIDRWRENTGAVPDASSLTFGAFRGGPGGKPLEIRLLADSTEGIKPAAKWLKDQLREFPGVKDVQDDALPGKIEMKIRLKKEAHSLGVDLRVLALQLRGAFYGDEGLKIQRGRDEIKVRVRYPEHQRRGLGDVEQMRVRTTAGDQIPFVEVADVEMSRGYTTLRRASGKSVVTISADVDETVNNAEKILDTLKAKGGAFERLRAAFPGIEVDLRGQRQQRTEAFSALKVFYPIALLGIYTLLAGIFKSYFQPIIIMIAIPFGLVGAVIGHQILGYDVTLLSMFGLVALTGIVVNDSLVLIDYVNRGVR
ncbi:hypothetical protein LCGC14_2949250, partial [marine sediment metagenome]